MFFQAAGKQISEAISAKQDMIIPAQEVPAAGCLFLTSRAGNQDCPMVPIVKRVDHFLHPLVLDAEDSAVAKTVMADSTDPEIDIRGGNRTAIAFKGLMPAGSLNGYQLLHAGGQSIPDRGRCVHEEGVAAGKETNGKNGKPCTCFPVSAAAGTISYDTQTAFTVPDTKEGILILLVPCSF